MAEITTSSRDGVRPMIPVGRRLWLWWVLAGTVGWAVGGPLGVAVGRSGDIMRITTVQSEASPATSGLGDHAQAFVVAEGISAQFSLGGELSDSIDLCGPALSVSHAPSMHLGVDFRVNPALLSETAASV